MNKVSNKIVDSAENTQSSEMEELKKQFAEMQKQLINVTKELNKAKKVSVKDDIEDEDGIVVHDETKIKVMSLCPHELNLSTESKGRGRIFTFNNFGEVKNIRYVDVGHILENQKHFLEQGLFIILNEKVVKKEGLEDIYKKILTKDMIEQVVLGNTNQTDAVNIFKSAGEKQQKIIVEMMVAKKVAGENVDLNLADRISKIYCYNKDGEKIRSTITEQAEEAKEYQEIFKAQQIGN
jgi:hypothetical protein